MEDSTCLKMLKLSNFLLLRSSCLSNTVKQKIVLWYSSNHRAINCNLFFFEFETLSGLHVQHNAHRKIVTKTHEEHTRSIRVH